MQPKRQGRPPTIENARDRILDDAATLFAQGGFDGTTLGDVADAVGVTKAAIYHYYPSKKKIYEDIIVRTLQGLLEAVTAAVADGRETDIALSRFMIAHADYFERNYEEFQAMLIGYGGMQNVVMAAEAQKLRDDYEKLLRRILSRGIADGTFRKIDVKVTGRAILSMLNWMVRWYQPGKGRRAATFASEYCELIVAGIRKAERTA